MTHGPIFKDFDLYSTISNFFSDVPETAIWSGGFDHPSSGFGVI